VSGSAQQCFSQGTLAQLDAQACFVASDNTQRLLCAPASVAPINYACPQLTTIVSGISQPVPVPSCSNSIGTISYSVGNSSVATINDLTNQITAQLPGTTVITASVAQSGSSAGYFSTCPPKSINVTLANGATAGTITQGVSQGLVTTVLDTNNVQITGLSLNYQSTDPVDISVGAGGTISTNFPGVASLYAVCEPPSCNPSPINEIGLYGTGLSIASKPVEITVPGTATDFVWFSSPGQSQYFVPVELLTGTLGSPVRLPYVPNSMVMDRGGSNLYFGSSRELMIYNALNNSLSKQDTSAPGVVLAVSPDNTTLLINDQVRQVFYIYNTSGGITSTNGGMGNAAAWTPDSQTLYVSDNASLGAGHSDAMYVYSQYTGWTSYPLPPSPLPAASLPPNSPIEDTVQTPALTIPGVGAYFRGNPTVAHTWCPSGTVGNSSSIAFYPQGDSVSDATDNPVQTDTLAATTDGNHILGATLVNGGVAGGVTLSDIGVTIPDTECPGAGSSTLTPLIIQHTLNQVPLSKVTATAVDQVAPATASNLAFITYTGSTPGALLPYYVPGSGGAAGTVGYVTLMSGASASTTVTAPLAGAFSPDDSLFFVSTAGDNMIHYISVPTVISNLAKPLNQQVNPDTQQVAPNLPACTPGGVDPGCTLAAPITSPVPATVITVKPRVTT